MDATAVSREVKKRTGVTMEIQYATTKDSQELNTIIASGNLPDFLLYSTGSAVRTTLWKQGYLSSLNKLMDEYAPDMRNIIPKDMDIYWSESDGNMYLIPQYYTDLDKCNKIQGVNLVSSGFDMHKATYEALGKPKTDTLDDYKSLLLQVKEKYSDKFDFFAYDGCIDDPTRSDKNMAELLNRIYGGTNTRAVAEDGTVHLNFKDETYKKAILYMNDLYRSGLFNPENFTAVDQFKEFAANQKIFSYWGQAIALIEFDMADEATRPYHSYEPPKAPGIVPKFYNVMSGIGMNSGLSISANSKNKARAIQYMEFLLSEEGQMLLYHGIEGEHYTMEEGYPKNTDIKNKAWDNWTDMVNELGIMGALNWIPLMETDAKYYYWLNKSKLAYAELQNNVDKYAAIERNSVLAVVPSDSEEKVIENKVIELWKNAMPKMILAKTQEECLSEYDKFLKDADALGLAKLETAYTAVVKGWLEKLK